MSNRLLPIRTERLALRNFRPTDLDSVERYLKLPEVQRYLAWKIRDRVQYREMLDIMCRQTALQRPGDILAVAVTLRDSGELIGQVSLVWADATAGQGEIAFALSPDWRGRGYAAEAVQAIIALGFDDLRLHRVFARTNARNHGSVALLRRLGFRLEAHFREHALYQGEWFDELHFAMLDREWKRGARIRELAIQRAARGNAA